MNDSCQQLGFQLFYDIIQCGMNHVHARSRNSVFLGSRLMKLWPLLMLQGRASCPPTGGAAGSRAECVTSSPSLGQNSPLKEYVHTPLEKNSFSRIGEYCLSFLFA